ncbi:phosphate ABC transporter substrate-binding protein PstS [Zavarzinella formosa]|uniref:phosphate ABC transporter substrate-binding protein PstS n=1 Tax=Zavarzinella formosa TaxID=360055 RepID=UPI00138AE1F8|nr:phosphate ABC transporter substrate-binding protein PstS [Zavarzinella formosa]
MSLRSLIERSGLLSAQALAPYFGGPASGDSAASDEAAAERLVRDGLLTPYQSRQLFKGHFDEFFINGKYKMLGLIGAGGMGKVFLCEHLLLTRLVAIKMLQTGESSSSASAVERFYREGRAVAALDHPNIVRVFDIDRIGSNPFMVLEYVDGSNLHDVVARAGALPADRAANYIRQVAAGLAQAHTAGLIHRDVKPGNILLDRSGAVKLLDLGLARFSKDTARNESITDRFDQHMVIGTADFMAPEQANGRSPADARSDIYSLGCTFYFLLTGRVPFPEGTAVQKLFLHQTCAPEPISELCPRLPAEISQIIDRMIDKDPDDRYQTAGEVIAALTPWTASPVPPPAANEMPGVAASYYKLGLSPRDESSGQFVTPKPLSSMETERQVAPRRWAEPVEQATAASDYLATPSPGTGAKTAPATAAIPPAKQTSWLLLSLATAAILMCMFVIWQQSQNHHNPAPTTKGEPGLAPDTPITPQPQAGPFAGVILNAGGSTFVNPVLSRWTGVYEKSRGVRIDYQPVGSGKGVTGMTDRVFLFGCTDAPMTDGQLAAVGKSGGAVIHIPLVMGAVVPAYNLPGVDEQLMFTGPILADIYLGKITRWNDPAIVANNPGVKLPDMPIQVVRRSDSSGTTHIWTDYLAKVSAEWRDKHGVGTEVRFPVGQEAKGNNGITGVISRNIGSLGYVELTYAMQNNLRYGKVKNREGSFVNPSLESVTAACSSSLTKIPADLRYSLTDAPGEESYPIAGTAWAVLFVDQTGNASGRELIDLLRWATHEGQSYARELKYAPLPPELVPLIDGKLNSVRLAPTKGK